VAGPVVWNSLPAAVREADTLYAFKNKLKTRLFNFCFNDRRTCLLTVLAADVNKYSVTTASCQQR